jgi:hypothetical protein
MVLPLTVMEFSSALISTPLSVPSMESYFSKWALVLGSEVSLIPTNSKLLFCRVNQQRKTLRPIRPKPLIATLITYFVPPNNGIAQTRLKFD